MIPTRWATSDLPSRSAPEAGESLGLARRSSGPSARLALATRVRDVRLTRS